MTKHDADVLQLPDTDLKVFRSPAEYGFEAHLAEVLIEASHELRELLEHGLPNEAVTAAAFWRFRLTEEHRPVIKSFLKAFNKRRPDCGRQDPLIFEITRVVESLFDSSLGKTALHLYRRIEGRLGESVARIKNWVRLLAVHVEKITEEKAFDWIERTDSLMDSALSLEERQARLRRVVNMLDEVIARGDIDLYQVIDESQAAECDNVVGYGVPSGPFTVSCFLNPPACEKSFTLPPAKANSAVLESLALSDDPTKPDSRGYVKEPEDENSFVPMKVILDGYCQNVPISSLKQIGTVLDDFSVNDVRWTRPFTKRGAIDTHRRNVHIGDWIKFAEKLRAALTAKPVEGSTDPTRDQIALEGAKLREGRFGNK